ncbi:MAG: response regulator [Proteobacteria bacterium]|nr:response regulator [Pseudomonadota bacterium]
MIPIDLNILVAEDSATQAAYIRQLLLQQGYRVAVAKNGREALERLEKEIPNILITDVIMPEMDGYELCRAVRADARFSHLPIILLTSLADSQDVIRGLECGADCFFTKPADNKELLFRIMSMLVNPTVTVTDEKKSFEVVFGNERQVVTTERHRVVSLLVSTFESAVQQQRMLAEVRLENRALKRQLARCQKQLEESNDAASADALPLDAELPLLHQLAWDLGGVVEHHDPFAVDHQHKVTELVRTLARRLDLDPQRTQGLLVAAALHDVGKLAVDPSLLGRQGTLTPAEMEQVRQHAVAGSQHFQGSTLPWPVERIIAQHHERLDGSGYPEGARADDILLEARILAVADVAVAMCEERPHRPAPGRAEAILELRKFAGILYDARVVAACLQAIDEDETLLR